ncbi:hypothetical protein IAG41_22605 [Sphingomonas sp. JC676]|uniref:hypothetical protein n=1 Tax=Sphingomonas sp. JC676 TaxID=2768065 RepID=UPI0016580047|nr:hypothetical protein [Sphingomonas sp. JC676]MBC9035191.1 hypothetical protein [Sphingomonas sp. JC676]
MHARHAIAGALLSLVGACTSPLTREGRLPPAAAELADPTYVLAAQPAEGDAPASDAVALVRAALASKGYREAPNGHYRLEVGLAVAPAALDIGRGEAAEPPAVDAARNPIVLCRPRRHVLTVGMIDRTNGAVLFRNVAAARHCGPALEEILPRMARAAVNG